MSTTEKPSPLTGLEEVLLPFHKPPLTPEDLASGEKADDILMQAFRNRAVELAIIATAMVSKHPPNPNIRFPNYYNPATVLSSDDYNVQYKYHVGQHQINEATLEIAVTNTDQSQQLSTSYTSTFRVISDETQGLTVEPSYNDLIIKTYGKNSLATTTTIIPSHPRDHDLNRLLLLTQKAVLPSGITSEIKLLRYKQPDRRPELSVELKTPENPDEQLVSEVNAVYEVFGNETTMLGGATILHPSIRIEPHEQLPELAKTAADHIVSLLSYLPTVLPTEQLITHLLENKFVFLAVPGYN